MRSAESGVPAPNNWTVYDTDDVFTWESTVPGGLSGDEMLAWQDAVLAAGEKHSVMRVVAAPNWDFRRDRDGPVLEWLRRHGERIEPMWPYPSGFLLGRVLQYHLASLLSYSGPDGIVDIWASNVSDLALAAGLPLPRLGNDPPLSVETNSEDDGGFTATISTATDIWFARNDPRPRLAPRPIDNSALARLNGARLNAFLVEVRAACRAVGGAWTWDTVPGSYGYREADEDGFVVLE